MNKNILKFYSAIFSIAFLYFIFVATIYIVCFFDINGLYKLITKLDTVKELPFDITDTDLKNLCSELMKYLSLKIPFLETKISINGALVDFYSLKTKIHMADVRNIFKILIYGSYISIGVCILTFFQMFKFIKNPLLSIKKSFIHTVIIFALILIPLSIYINMSFDTFFIKFHQILFNNDLWLLDPDVDYIICLLPENLFMIYAFRIIFGLIIGIFITISFLHFLSKTQPPQEAK